MSADSSNLILRRKIVNGLIILSSLLGYLEWSGGSNTLLGIAEAEILVKLFSKPLEVLHPFVLIPLFGQILLLITLFQKQPSRLLTYTGIFSLAILLLLILFIGFLSLNWKIIISVIPFVTLFVYALVIFRKKSFS